MTLEFLHYDCVIYRINMKDGIGYGAINREIWESKRKGRNQGWEALKIIEKNNYTVVSSVNLVNWNLSAAASGK